MAGISLAGLSSGLDTNALIEGLMSVERVPRTRITLQQAAVQARQDALRQVADKLKALKTAADDLSSFTTWGATQNATSSDATIAGARLTAGAAPGTYAINVTQLATAEQRTYSYASRTSDRTVKLNNLDLTIAANSTLDTVVSQINNDPNYGVYAVNSGNQLVLTSRTTGQAINYNNNGFSILTETSSKPFKNAQYTIDGGALQTSSTNTISSTSGATGFITGVELTLQKVGTFNVEVTPPTVDKTVVSNKMKAFVDAYNAALDLMSSKVGEKKVPGATTNSDAAKGALWADSTITNIMGSLRASMSTFMQTGNSTAYDELAEAGISTGIATGSGINQDSVKGKLVFDSKQFEAAFAAKPDEVQKLLGGLTGTNGFAQAFNSVLTPYTQAAGLLDSRIDAAGSELTRLADSLTRMDDRLGRKQDMLQKMFTALEVSLQRTRSQGQELLAKLGVSDDS
jgi:flagellar hook-associated protein 2